MASDRIQDLVGHGSTTLEAAIESQQTLLQNATMHAHSNDADKRSDHLAMLDLFPDASDPDVAVAVNGGSWFDPSTWANGRVPGDGQKVYIPQGISVVYDGVSDARLDRVGVDGELHFAVDTDTKMVVDTLLANSTSVFTIGTEDNPVQAGVNAEIVIHRDNGAINLAEDPNQLSKGIVAHGATRIAGQDKTDHLRTAEDPQAGDTSLILSEQPAGWQIGDKIVVAGTKLTGTDEFQDETALVTGVQALSNGTYRVTLDRALQYDHDTPEDFAGESFSVPVANYTRNIRIGTETTDEAYTLDGNSVPIDERGHVMFMHNGDVSVQNAEFYELGRTDKSIPIDDDSNVASRYALHFHRTGGQTGEEPALAEGNAVWGSPGWGIVHHDSNLDVISNAVYGVNGAAIVAEAGTETGIWADNITMSTTGSGPGPKFNPENSGSTTHDGYLQQYENDAFGQGVGFAYKSRMVENFDNVAVSSSGAGYLFWPMGTDDGSGRHMDSDADAFEAVYGYDPFYGQDSSSVSKVPIRFFANNEALVTPMAFVTTADKRPSDTDMSSIIEHMVGWEVNFGVVGWYQRDYLIKESVFVASEDSLYQGTSKGVRGHEFHEVKLVDNAFKGFEVGVWEDNNSLSNEYNHVILGNQFEANGVDMQLDSNADSSFYIVSDNSADWANDYDVGHLEAQVNLGKSDLVLSTWYDHFSVVVDKVDTLGAKELTFGSEKGRYGGASQKNWWKENAASDGYYTDGGSYYLLVDILVGDRVTGTAGVITVPVELAFVTGPADLPEGATNNGALPAFDNSITLVDVRAPGESGNLLDEDRFDVGSSGGNTGTGTGGGTDGSTDGGTDGGTDTGTGGSTDGGNDGGTDGGTGTDTGTGYAEYIEAEDMALTNYRIESKGNMSGNQMIGVTDRTVGEGRASHTFDGPGGTYDIKVGYLDENDGQSRVELMVGGQTIESWNLTADDNAVHVGLAENVSVASGDEIVVIGYNRHGERARLDFVEISGVSDAGSTEPDVEDEIEAPDGAGAFAARVEVEAMSLDNYEVERSPAASEGERVKVAAKSEGAGLASFTFDGPAGTYDLDLGVFDEEDGEGEIAILVDGEEVGSWSLDANTHAARELSVEDVVIGENATVTIVGQWDRGEYARADYLEITSSDLDMTTADDFLL